MTPCRGLHVMLIIAADHLHSTNGNRRSRVEFMAPNDDHALAYDISYFINVIKYTPQIQLLVLAIVWKQLVFQFRCTVGYLWDGYEVRSQVANSWSIVIITFFISTMEDFAVEQKNNYGMSVLYSTYFFLLISKQFLDWLTKEFTHKIIVRMHIAITRTHGMQLLLIISKYIMFLQHCSLSCPHFLDIMKAECTKLPWPCQVTKWTNRVLPVYDAIPLNQLALLDW